MSMLAFTSLAIWLVLLFARGGFWRVERDVGPPPETEYSQNTGFPRPTGPSQVPAPDRIVGPSRFAVPVPSREMADWGSPARVGSSASRSVVAIVPARNEAGTIGQTLPSLLSQNCFQDCSQNLGGRFHVVVVDDHSDDGTAAEARRAAAAIGRDDRLTVLACRPLPAGWTGKLWAMEEGVSWASREPDQPDLILFCDADIMLSPGIVRALVADADRRGVVLASLMVTLRAQSPAERWLVPAFVYFFRMLYPFARVNRPASGVAAAAGGVMLVDRRTLATAGGLRAIRAALIDDCALGRLMKRHGPISLSLTRDARSIRAYPTVADIRRMVVRSAYAELRYSPWRLAVALGGLALVFAVPPVCAIAGNGAARVAGFAGWAAMAGSFVPMLRFYRVPAWRALCLPLIAALYAMFTVQSALEHRSGRGGAWKGRLQAPVQTQPGR